MDVAKWCKIFCRNELNGTTITSQTEHHGVKLTNQHRKRNRKRKAKIPKTKPKIKILILVVCSMTKFHELKRQLESMTYSFNEKRLFWINNAVKQPESPCLSILILVLLAQYRYLNRISAKKNWTNKNISRKLFTN